MGNDLYWKVTPRPKTEKLNDLYYNTWHYLKDLYKYDDLNDLGGKILTSKDIEIIKPLLITAKANNNKNLELDILELIEAIENHGSITLTIRG